MAISLFSDAYTDKSADKLHDIRFVGAIEGCYSLPDRAKAKPGDPTVFACRSQSISTHNAVLQAPVQGQVGNRVSIKLQEFNILTGRVSRVFSGGFAFDIQASEAERTEIAAKIDWIKKRRFRAFKDKRAHKRVAPPNPQSAITLPDGDIKECFIIDVSQSGVAVSADVLPPVGSRVAIGRATGTIVRHLDVGFATKFDTRLALDQIDQIFTWSLNYLHEDQIIKR